MSRISVFFRNAIKDWNIFEKMLALLVPDSNKPSGYSSKWRKLTQSDAQTKRPTKDPPEHNYKPVIEPCERLSPPDNMHLGFLRKVDRCEILGAGANKTDTYKNAEYYAYHRYSYAMLLEEILKVRSCGPTHEVEYVVECPKPPGKCAK